MNIAMNTALIPVNFHDEIVELVNFEGQPYFAVKRITTNLGLSWPAQYRKLMDKFGSTVAEIATVAEDGKLRTVVCLPIRKLAAWLNTIQANKLTTELRTKVLCYQAECDDALWDYWTKGVALNPRLAQSALSVNETISLSRECARLLEKVAESTNATLARELYKHLQRMTAALGDQVAPLDQLAPGLRQQSLPLE